MSAEITYPCRGLDAVYRAMGARAAASTAPQPGDAPPDKTARDTGREFMARLERESAILAAYTDVHCEMCGETIEEGEERHCVGGDYVCWWCDRSITHPHEQL